MFRLAALFLLRLHAPKEDIHHNHDQRDHRHGDPEAHVQSQPVRCSEQRHPNILPVHLHTSLQQLAVVADIGFFQTGRQHHVEQDAGNQIGKISSGQGDKAQCCAERRKGNERQHGNAGHGQHRHGGRRRGSG